MYENLLESTVVRANFLNPDVAFPRNERLRSGVGVRESYNARDVLETTVVVHTNLKEKRKTQVSYNIHLMYGLEGNSYNISPGILNGIFSPIR